MRPSPTIVNTTAVTAMMTCGEAKLALAAPATVQFLQGRTAYFRGEKILLSVQASNATATVQMDLVREPGEQVEIHKRPATAQKAGGGK